jgi:hypothetical protein
MGGDGTDTAAIPLSYCANGQDSLIRKGKDTPFVDKIKYQNR